LALNLTLGSNSKFRPGVIREWALMIWSTKKGGSI